MTTLTIMILLILGILLLVLGFITEKRLLKIISIIPLGISIVQIIILLAMAI